MAAKLTGKTAPRLWSPPLRTLTRRTSLGYAVADFAERIGFPLLAWQKWLVVHALELNRDGKTLRFRIVLCLVGRQNGKTEVARILSLYKLYVMGDRLVLGAAQGIGMARENLNGCLEMAQACPWLAPDIAQVRRSNGDESFLIAEPLTYRDKPGDESFTLAGHGRYKICASNRRAGRGLSVDHLSIDEIREWTSEDGWSALSKTTNARINGQAWAFTNAGDDRSVTLNRLRESALAGTEESIGIFEWSGADDCDLLDWEQIRQANPALGVLVSPSAIRTAHASDTEETFRTEILCQRVSALNAAVNLRAWEACADPSVTLEGMRDRLAVCLDVAMDGEHATLAAAATLPGGEVAVEVAGAWRSTDAARAELPALLAKLRPKVIAWYPGGPAQMLASVLRPARQPPWKPEYAEISGGKACSACMEFSDLVTGRRIVHPGQELLSAQVRGASKLKVAEGWRFTRLGGSGHVDSVYAAAGAAQAALTMPEPQRVRLRVLELR